MTAGRGGAACLSEGGRIMDFLCSLLSILLAGGVASMLRHAFPAPALTAGRWWICRLAESQ